MRRETSGGKKKKTLKDGLTGRPLPWLRIHLPGNSVDSGPEKGHGVGDRESGLRWPQVMMLLDTEKAQGQQNLNDSVEPCDETIPSG